MKVTYDIARSDLRNHKLSAGHRVQALTALATGETIANVCAEWGISAATLYTWKKNYAGMASHAVVKFDRLAQQNVEMYRRITTLELDIKVLQEALQMQALRPDQKRALICVLIVKFGVSLARMSRLLGISRTSYAYAPTRERQ